MSLLQARERLATGAVLKVLIVDDDVKLVEGLATFLERAGYEVERVWNLGDALMVIKHERPDVVLLGGRTDGLDAMEILHRIRAIDRSIPAIVVTTGDEPAPGRDPRERGVYGFRVGPREMYRLDRLDQMVAEALISSRRRGGWAMEG